MRDDFRLDANDSSHKLQREEAEMKMHELTVLAQHTSVSLCLFVAESGFK